MVTTVAPSTWIGGLPDFDLVASWLSQPDVARWWAHEWTPEAVERDFGPTVDGREPNHDWLGLLDGERNSARAGVERASWDESWRSRD